MESVVRTKMARRSMHLDQTATILRSPAQNEWVIALHSPGMSVREIQALLAENYDTEVSSGVISSCVQAGTKSN
ncbi:hypothetical protein [Burkholderia plantarii]|uniref:hypothetical protein n=1 Tax=Burkholderia plantarii TaxID=41899 RepID=UPI0018DEA41C|nr:hypothetical protein [Burkholderia plantarii]MBI0331724.1 hypothetical protein [Burkholderia plantarii]